MQVIWVAEKTHTELCILQPQTEVNILILISLPLYSHLHQAAIPPQTEIVLYEVFPLNGFQLKPVLFVVLLVLIQSIIASW